MIFKNKKFLNYIILFSTFLLIIFFYLYKLGDIPAGLFCDEAEIGNISGQVLKGDFSNFINPFFYYHFNYALGFLHIYLIIPFILFFGMTEFSIRLSSVFFSILSLIFIYKTFKLLNFKYKLLPIILFAFTPIFFHLSRINFGHLYSLFFFILGFYYYLLSKYKNNKLLSILSGAFFGIAAYGYIGNIITIPIFIGFLGLQEFIKNKFKLPNYKNFFILLITIIIIYIPIFYTAFTNSTFTQRFREKNSTISIVSYKKIKEILTNYPKYYSYDFLFKKATVDLGDFVSRHSIRGNGIFLQISSALLLLSFIGLIFDKDKKKYKLIPFFILFFLYSIPDLITTKNNVPPYTFSLFTIIYFLPFLSAYGLDFLIRFLSKDKMFKNIVIYAIFIILVFQIGQFLNNYNKYPLYSSDYWGWQYGPKEIIKYFIKEKNNYDEFYMTGSFNQPISLLNFYNYKKNCKSCFIGGINEYNSSKKQLYAIRTSEINEISKSHPSLIFKEINSIKLPNGYKEFLIGTFQEQ